MTRHPRQHESTPRTPLPLCACGSAELLAVRPGAEAVMAPGGIVVVREVPPVGWCEACWPWLQARAA